MSDSMHFDVDKISLAEQKLINRLMTLERITAIAGQNQFKIITWRKTEQKGFQKDVVESRGDAIFDMNNILRELIRMDPKLQDLLKEV